MDKEIYCSLNINQKINFRDKAIFYLSTKQYFQLIKLHKLVLAPYYAGLLRKQAKEVEDARQFKEVYGAYRFEYENRRLITY